MEKLSNTQMKSLDEWLFNYKDVSKQIAIRKLELQTDNPNNDCNIGGGRANRINKVTEDIVAKWDSDGRIKSYENFKDSVERLRSILDDELNEVFKLRWEHSSCRTWEEIADTLHVSTKSIYRKRERILTLFALEMGLI